MGSMKKSRVLFCVKCFTLKNTLHPSRLYLLTNKARSRILKESVQMTKPWPRNVGFLFSADDDQEMYFKHVLLIIWHNST